MRIGILFNDTHESLARALRAILPEADIVNYPLDPAIADEAALRGCDHILTQEAGLDFGALSNQALATATDRLHVLPRLVFRGFHPDTVTLTLDGAPIAGPTGTLHSRIAVAGFLAGLPADETAALYTALPFARLGYGDALATAGAALLDQFLYDGIDLSKLLPRWRVSGCFMHAPNHPKMRIMLDIARIACAKMGVSPQTPAALPADPLAAAAQHPYFADLARRHGLPPDGAFRAALPAPPLSALDFVQGSYDVFRRTPRACLRAVPGVTDAATRLDFPTAKRPARVLMPGAVALLTWHGTIVRLERASNLLVHEKLWPDSEDSVDFTLTPVAGEDGTVTATVLPGLDILPGAQTGTMALRREGRYLTADPTRFAMQFKAEAVGEWESFVPLTPRDAASLRAIGTRPWSVNGGASIHPATIRAGSAFQFHLGAQSADLRLQRPDCETPEADTVTLRNAAGKLSLQAAGGAAQEAGIPLIPAPSTAWPPFANALGAFRSTPEASWLLEATSVVLHPPLTVSAADAAWLAGTTTLPVGLRQGSLTLRRMPASLMLAPGFPCMLFNRAGVLAGGPEQLTPDPLPHGITRAHNILVADPAMLTEGQVLDGPVLVAPGLGGDDDDGFLVNTALPLLRAAGALPRGTRVLLPGMRPGQEALLAMLGLDALARVAPAAPVCQLRDGIWLELDGLPGLPLPSTRRLRAQTAARHAAPKNAPARILLQPEGAITPNPKLDKFLASRRFVTIVPETLKPAALRDLFLHASLIVAPSCAALANLVFCAEGTMVLELTPETEVNPRAWLIAEALGLVHGVLPCPPQKGGMMVGLARLRAMLRMLRIAADPNDPGREADQDSG
jgi:hypothetical protein